MPHVKEIINGETERAYCEKFSGNLIGDKDVFCLCPSCGDKRCRYQSEDCENCTKILPAEICASFENKHNPNSKRTIVNKYFRQKFSPEGT